MGVAKLIYSAGQGLHIKHNEGAQNWFQNVHLHEKLRFKMSEYLVQLQ